MHWSARGDACAWSMSARQWHMVCLVGMWLQQSTDGFWTAWGLRGQEGFVWGGAITLKRGFLTMGGPSFASLGRSPEK